MFSVNARKLRRINAGQRPVCDRCLSGEKLVVGAPEREFWKARFTSAEMVEIATAAWGPPRSWSDDWRSGFTFLPVVPEEPFMLAASSSP